MTEQASASTELDKQKAAAAVASAATGADEDKDKPWHKDPRFKDDLGALKIGKSIQNLLKENEVDSVEDLVDLAKTGRTVKGKIGDVNKLDELVADSDYLKKVKAYWADQKKKAALAGETPEQKANRLEKEKEELEQAMTDKERREKESADLKKAMDDFNSDIKKFIADDAEVPETHRDFISQFFGVGNPIDEVQLSDKKGVRKVLTDGLAKWKAFIKTVKEEGAKEYREGKLNIPKIAASGGGAPPPDTKIKLKEARRIVHERLKTGRYE